MRNVCITDIANGPYFCFLEEEKPAATKTAEALLPFLSHDLDWITSLHGHRPLLNPQMFGPQHHLQFGLPEIPWMALTECFQIFSPHSSTECSSRDSMTNLLVIQDPMYQLLIVIFWGSCSQDDKESALWTSYHHQLLEFQRYMIFLSHILMMQLPDMNDWCTHQD